MGLTVTAAALVVGCSRQTASKWVNRRRRGGSLSDRSSRPHCAPGAPASVERAILRARAELREGPHVIGWALGSPPRPSAPSFVATAIALVGRPPREPIVRYERYSPGELVHVDIKAEPDRATRPPRDRRSLAESRGRRLAVPVRGDRRPLPTRLRRGPLNETADSALAFLSQLVRFYGSHGIRVQRVLTDNGTCFKRRWADACEAQAITVKKTRAYRPQTNGKAERFIRTLLERWAYAYSYEHETERLAAWLQRSTSTIASVPHRALGGLTPLQRVNQPPWDIQLVEDSRVCALKR